MPWTSLPYVESWYHSSKLALVVRLAFAGGGVTICGFRSLASVGWTIPGTTPETCAPKSGCPFGSVLAQEIAKDSRHHQVAVRGVPHVDAVPAGLELAVRRAAVAGADVAVVALLAGQLEAVPAGGRAAARADTRRLGLAVGAAAVPTVGVAVIAGFTAFLDAVAAGRLMTGLAGRRAGEACFEATSIAATVAGNGVAVVALLGAEHHSIAAARETPRARLRADPAGLELTAPVTAVAGRRVAIVAGLGPPDDTVAAGHGVHAGSARRGADPVGLGMAVGRASVTPHLVAVVAGLRRRVEHAVSARRDEARSGRAIAGRIRRPARVDAVVAAGAAQRRASRTHRAAAPAGARARLRTDPGTPAQREEHARPRDDGDDGSGGCHVNPSASGRRHRCRPNPLTYCVTLGSAASVAWNDLREHTYEFSFVVGRPFLGGSQNIRRDWRNDSVPPGTGLAQPEEGLRIPGRPQIIEARDPGFDAAVISIRSGRRSASLLRLDARLARASVVDRRGPDVRLPVHACRQATLARSPPGIDRGASGRAGRAPRDRRRAPSF